MPLPSNPIPWEAPLDPSERLDYLARFDTVLERGERIDSFDVELLPEAAALGISIVEDAPHAPRLVEGDTAVMLRFAVAEPNRQDPAFSESGVVVGVVFTLETDGDRTRQRTYALALVQQ